MHYTAFGKTVLRVWAVSSLFFVAACTVNPATGDKQFTALMSPQQEKAIGAEQHAKIIEQYGGVYQDPALQNYVNEIGQKLAKNTERPDVSYKFTLLDSPVINAFALPGGYIYVTRGLLAVANDEAELAAVLGHEIGHVTGRHQAERYSQGLLTALGATVVSAAVGDPNVTEALSLGNNLYMSSYSRDQESQADQLGVRYVSRAGYDPFAVSDFLKAMEGYLSTEARVEGKEDKEFSYFSSHPDTAERATKASSEATRYSPSSNRGAESYLSALRGMAYGDGEDQGFVSGRKFVHPKLGFAFSVPEGYEIINQPDQVVASGQNGELIVLDMASKTAGLDPVAYISRQWLEGGKGAIPEPLTINGMEAATTSFPASLNGEEVTIRLVAINWGPKSVFRFQFAIPQGVSGGVVEDMKRTTYSFRRLSGEERNQVKARRIDLVTAKAGDRVEDLAARMSVDKAPLLRFRALNGLGPRDSLQVGRKYKIISG